MLDITDIEFDRIKDIMYAHSGVYLKPNKKQLVISRLHKRLADLKIAGFDEYIKIIERSGSNELSFFVNAITTNETYFFRHSKQFNLLFETVLPQIVEAKKNSGRNLVIWSAACASGEEPYSLAITCYEFFKAYPDFKWNIYASDINNKVLDEARRGIFTQRSLRETPAFIRDKYFHGLEISAAIKAKVEFLEHNLLSLFGHKNIDIVFLRNAMIYFDETSRRKVLDLVLRTIANNGFLFVSPSESLNDINSGLVSLNSAVYQKRKTNF